MDPTQQLAEQRASAPAGGPAQGPPTDPNAGGQPPSQGPPDQVVLGAVAQILKSPARDVLLQAVGSIMQQLQGGQQGAPQPGGPPPGAAPGGPPPGP